MVRRLVELRDGAKTVYRWVDDEDTADSKRSDLAIPAVSMTTSRQKHIENSVMSYVEKARAKAGYDR